MLSAEILWEFKIWYRVLFKSSRSTIPSTNPCSIWNSALWKPLGSFWPMVCSMTRGPAKPISAPGSARIISPSMAKLAVTPPVVGSVSTDTYKSPASECFLRAAAVLAICIREMIPSCIRAPPEQVKSTTGSRSLVARSTASAIFSPTTWPMLPIRNLASQMPRQTFSPSIRASPTVTPSWSPVFSFTSFSFSSYPGNLKGLLISLSSYHGIKLSLSHTIRILFFVLIRK